MKKYLVKIVTGLLLIGLISACGFHLRGKIELPPEMARVFIEAKDLRLAGQLGQSLAVSGAKLVTNAKQATAILKIYSAGISKKVRSVGGIGRVREYQLVYTVNFGIKDASGQVVMERKTATLIRDFSFNESQVIGKSVEESVIRAEMQRQMIATLMRRIQLNFKAKSYNNSTRGNR